MSKAVSARNLKKLEKLGGVPKADFEALRVTCEQTQYVIYTLAGFEAALVVGKGIKKLASKKKKESLQDQIDDMAEEMEELSGLVASINENIEATNPDTRIKQLIDESNDDILDKVSELLDKNGISVDGRNGIALAEIEKEIGRIMLEIKSIKDGEVPAGDLKALTDRVDNVEKTLTAFVGEVEGMRASNAELTKALQAQMAVNKLSSGNTKKPAAKKPAAKEA